MQTSETKWKIKKKIFSSLYFWTWIGCFKISLFSREYLSSGVNMLTNGLKVLDTIKTNIYKLKFSQGDGKVRQNYYPAHLGSACNTLTFSLSYGVLKCDSLHTYISTSFAVYNPKKYISYEAHLFFQNVEN